MTADRVKALSKLREKFPASSIAKLPKVSCYNCTEANKQRRGSTCGEHRKAECKECGSFLSTAHVHLDYVGHAETTDRLLDADPEWTWEPLAFDANGLPAADNFGGLWIRLTVAGVTRLGYGSADGKPGPNGVKEAIGDAIRNAAMRFGVALDLWAKTDLHADEDGPEEESEPERPARRERGQAEDEWSNAAPAMATPAQLDDLAQGLRIVRGAESPEARRTAVSQILGRVVGEDELLTRADAERALSALREEDRQNAAMRRQDGAQAPQSAPKPQLASGAQLTLLNTLTTNRGLADRAARLAFLSGFVKRQLMSSKDLTKDEATAIIDRLKAEPSPESLPVREALAKRIAAANSSDELADISDQTWAAKEAGQLDDAQVQVLMDLSLAREGELAQMAGASR